ncbi:hypothetical protein Rmet_6050 (plasmid) [Cupriavidus metallidurans CH34]|uniref:Uncharacterized protein n=1 Tax=Cupriavidus metallidurans (strain ATCC 43123 / DSM 2839 / NBRC 102507 / CH34) TaxID=266264 RepID=Q1LAB7_CUPMC|nr:hypothetical protein Rmet_6050 [Cupriavidus metallidurans CH34]
MSTDPVTIGTTTEIHEYAFDVRLSCAVRVKATSKAEAIKLLDRIQGNSANLGSWPNGDPGTHGRSLRGNREISRLASRSMDWSASGRRGAVADDERTGEVRLRRSSEERSTK